MKQLNLFRILLCSALALTVIPAQAGVKERMKARVPEIRSLKTKGVIGENRFGYLEFVAAAREKEQLVKDENQDRTAVYTAIAKQQQTTASVVGERRAIQIATSAPSGDFIQQADGSWKKKP